MSYISDDADRLRQALPADLVPGEDAESLMLLYAVLLHAKGVLVTDEDVHDAWTAWMDLRGHGHESKVPFGQLSAEIRQEDGPYTRVIRNLAKELLERDTSDPRE